MRPILLRRLGHDATDVRDAGKDVTDRYAEQLKEDIECPKQEAEKAGLGFKLPALESTIGLLGLPNH
jgi:hypothetical protein